MAPVLSYTQAYVRLAKSLDTAMNLAGREQKEALLQAITRGKTDLADVQTRLDAITVPPEARPFDDCLKDGLGDVQKAVDKLELATQDVDWLATMEAVKELQEAHEHLSNCDDLEPTQ